jgi:hypothetical protein
MEQEVDPENEEQTLSMDFDDLHSLMTNLGDDNGYGINFNEQTFIQINRTIICNIIDELDLTFDDDRTIMEVIAEYIHKYILSFYNASYVMMRGSGGRGRSTGVHLTFINGDMFILKRHSFINYVVKYVVTNYENHGFDTRVYSLFDSVVDNLNRTVNNTFGDNITNLLFLSSELGGDVGFLGQLLFDVFRAGGVQDPVHQVEQISEEEFIDQKYGRHNAHSIKFKNERCERTPNGECCVCFNRPIGKCNICGGLLCSECLNEVKKRSGECPTCRDSNWEFILFNDVHDFENLYETN